MSELQRLSNDPPPPDNANDPPDADEDACPLCLDWRWLVDPSRDDDEPVPCPLCVLGEEQPS